MTGSRTLDVAAWVGLPIAAVYVLVRGSEVLIPLAVAAVLWYLLVALAGALAALVPGGSKLPRWFWIAFALVIVAGALFVTFNLLSSSLSGITLAAPKYQENLNALLERAAGSFGMEKAPGVEQLIEKVDLKWAVGGVAGIATVIAGDIVLILVYVLFLLLEQETFGAKVRALAPDPAKRAAYSDVLDRVQESIRGYVLIKTLLSLMMGLATFVTLKIAGVDYAFFWAFVAFMANYIPTVGALVGVALPVVFALVQFPTPATGLVVAAVLGVIHFIIGDVIEPRWMGAKLNISSFVVILSLVVWGKIWGITGMFLCVPLTVIMMIIFAQFPATRPIAVLLSGDGDLSFACKRPSQDGEAQ